MIGLWIVIPSFDDWPVVERCLISLDPSNNEFTVCVVDHGRTGLVAKELKLAFPGVVALRGSPHLWWTGATNLGIRCALEQGAEFVMLLNSDCVIEPASVRRVTTAVKHHGAIVAPLQRNLRTDEVHAARAWTALTAGFPTLYVEKREPPREIVNTRMIVGGRGVVIPRHIFGMVGLFDEHNLPHYLADHDFYLRARRAGEQLLIDRSSSVWVDHSRTSYSTELQRMTWGDFVESLSNRQSHRSLDQLIAFFRSNYPVPGLWPIGVVLNVTRYLLTRMWARARARVAAVG